MKSMFELYEEKSNNWLHLNGYAMARFGGKRKRSTHRERVNLPFPDYKDLKKRNRFK